LTWTTTPPASSQGAGVPTRRASAVALEAFTEAALAARRHPHRRVLLKVTRIDDPYPTILIPGH
jgi:hypothetical protein